MLAALDWPLGTVGLLCPPPLNEQQPKRRYEWVQGILGPPNLS